jgi:hypothetical protein
MYERLSNNIKQMQQQLEYSDEEIAETAVLKFAVSRLRVHQGEMMKQMNHFLIYSTL